MSPSSKWNHPMVQLHLGVLLLGGSGLFAKLVHLPAVDIIAYRGVVTALVLGLFLFLIKTPIRLRSLQDYKAAFGLGFLAALHWVTYFYSIQQTSVAVGMISLFTYPVIIVLLDPLLDKKLPKVKDIFLSISVLFGISLLFPNIWSGADVSSEYTFGVLVGLFSAFCFAARNIGIQRTFKGYSGTQNMFYQFLVTSILVYPFVETEPLDMGWSNFYTLMIFAVFFSALAHVLFATSIKNVGAKTAGLVACLQPLYGIVFGLILLAEKPSFMTVIGGAIILAAAIYETNQAGKKKKSG